MYGYAACQNQVFNTQSHIPSIYSHIPPNDAFALRRSRNMTQHILQLGSNNDILTESFNNNNKV